MNSFRAGTEVMRDQRTGDVFAELLVKSSDGSDSMPVVTRFSSPWSLGMALSLFYSVVTSTISILTDLSRLHLAATGNVFDVEVRDSKNGDSAFLAVTSDVGGKSITDLKDSFFTNELFSPTGRFSLYGQPTDIKIRKATTTGDYRIIDVSFSTLSQSTQTEIPRYARITATIPKGATQAIMLVGSASASRWKKGSDQTIASVVNSFRAVPAPQSSLKMRAKERDSNPNPNHLEAYAAKIE